jgi:hypothetical protein
VVVPATVDVVVESGVEVVVEGMVVDWADVGRSAGAEAVVSDVPHAPRRRPRAMTVILDLDPTELMAIGYLRQWPDPFSAPSSPTPAGDKVPTGRRHRGG